MSESKKPYCWPSNMSIYRRVWQFAWPAIISNISVPLLGLVDAMVLGHLPSAEYLAGVAIGATILTFLFWAFGFLRMGTTGLTAQAYGQQNHDDLRKCLLQSVFFALIIGLVLIAGSPLIISHVLPFFGASNSAAEQAQIYFDIRIFAAPAVLCNYAFIGWLLGMQKPKGFLIMLVAANSLNIILDLVLVLWLGMATEGAAIATVVADYFSLGLGLFLTWRLLSTLSGHFKWTTLIDSSFKQLLLLNRHLFIRTLCLLFTQAFFTSAGAHQSNSILAANALLLNLLMLISNALDGFAYATEGMAGEALGQNKLTTFREIVKITGFCSLICGLLFMLLFATGGSLLLSALTDLPEVRDTAIVYLPWLIAMPLIAVWCYWLDGVFIGALETRILQNTMIIATIIVFLPSWYFTQAMANHGLWLAYSLFMAARGISLWVTYQWFDTRNQWGLINS